MTQQRRSFSADFKARVALEALREQKTINELASEFGVHPNLIREWKRQALSELPQVFSSHKAANEKTQEAVRAYVAADEPLYPRDAQRVIEELMY